jgi:transposase
VTSPETLPNDIAALQTALTAERAARQQAEARASGAEAMVAYLKLLIAKMKRERFGQSAERGRKLLDQLELQLEELEASATEDEVAVRPAEPDPATVHGFSRKKPVRGPLPAHLRRERVVVPAPSSCPCCGGRLVKLGEDITETLEVVPRHGKVIQTVREKFTCRSCEKITQPPAPFHVIARARAGASLLAMILYAKFGEHQPLNRQSESFAREGIELDVSTLADWVGACTASLAPLVELIRRQVLAGERLHGDDTTVPVLAKDKTVIARLWTYVRDDRPFAGPDPPAAVFFYSRNRGGEHPSRHLAGYAGILQADAYAGFGDLYDARRRPGPITEGATTPVLGAFRGWERRRIIAAPGRDGTARREGPKGRVRGSRRERKSSNCSALTRKARRWGWGMAIYGGSPSKRATKFWALLCPASLRYARSRQAGPQKRDHRRAGRNSASHSSQWRISTAGGGASALRPFAGSLSTSSAAGDETHFCLIPLPRKSPSGGSLYRTRRNVRSPSLKVHVATAWNER